MLLLVSGATATLRTLPADARVGHLLTPRCGNSITTLLATGRPLAADNDCYQRLDAPAYIAMCHALALYRKRVLWVVVPDIVGDASATLQRWHEWQPFVASLGLQAAYVAQDGSEALAPPWATLDCLFIGGAPDTNWKESAAALALCHEAKGRGKWVHIGRVNTLRRLRLFDTVADSIDGTSFSRYPATYLPRWTARLNYRQECLL